jgi:adenylate cyclase class 2
MQEVEIKFRIADIASLKRSLRAAGFRVATRRTHEMNTLYDLPGNPLRMRGELLRVRLYGKFWTVTHKARASMGRHKSRTETETRVTDGAALEAILQASGFQPGFRYEKFRTELTDGRGHVVIDETPIGNFAEIEGSSRWIDEVARRLQVKPSQYITDSYAGLFFQWKSQTGSKAKNLLFAEVSRKPSP